MQCESCREETEKRVKVHSNGWGLWVCAACEQVLGAKKGKKKGGRR